MSKKHKTFVDLVLEGDALADDIDDFVDAWHEADEGEMSLHEFLGLTPHEYALWVENADMLPFILMSRKQGVEIDSRDWEETHQLAARAKPGEDPAKLIKWLKSTGRL